MWSERAEKRGFMTGVSYLSLSALLVKVIGLLYRIPMLAYLGTEGMGYFNTACELYALFCVLTSAGLPVAMSVLISRREGVGLDHAQYIRQTAWRTWGILGILGSLVMWGFARIFAGLLKNPEAASAMQAISPAVLLVSLASVYRGYFQGKRHMAPTAISQVIEALGKLLLGVVLAAYAQKKGYPLPQVAAYGVWGLTIGTGISLAYLWMQKNRYDRKHPSKIAEPPTHILPKLVSIALPVTLGGVVISLGKLIDLSLIFRRLQDAGMTATAVASLYGCYSTLVLPLFHALPTLTTAVSTSLLPTLSAMEGAGKSTEAKKITMFALLMTAGVSLMATLVLAFGGEMILHLIFPHQPTAVESATPWLSCIAWGIPFACLSGVLGGILQAEGHPVCPVIATGTGILVKGVLSYVLLSNPAMGILGVAVSTVLADILIFLILVGMMMKLTPWLCGLGKRDSVAMAVPSLPKTK